MDMLSQHVLDLLIIGIVITGIVRGAVTGHTQQLLDVLAAAVAFGVALTAMHPLSEFFTGYREPDDGRVLVVSFCLSFVFVFSLLFAVLRSTLYPAPESTSLPWLHRMLGAALGLILTVMLLSTAFTALGQVNEPRSTLRNRAMLYQPVVQYGSELWTAARIVMPLDPLPAYFEKRTPKTYVMQGET